MPLQLDGFRSGELESILRRAFNANSFESMLLHKLNFSVFDFVPLSANWATMVSRTVQRTNEDFITDKLIAAAREANPTNVALHEFSRQFDFGMTSIDKVSQELERVISENTNFLNPTPWREKLAEIETRVCRIEIQSNDGEINGTGFLLGSSTVLTNYHVVEPVIKGEKGEMTVDGYSAKVADVVCLFDYKRVGNNTLNRGVTYKLAADWLVDSSPNSSLDELLPVDCLDYALLRLDGTPGKDIVGNMIAGAGVQRGWISLPENAYDFRKDSPVFIMQHPKGSSLKLAFETKGVIELNQNKTRVRHRVNTENGSSGSPCFSQNWDLIALHHSGDPDFDPKHKPGYNEAIPMAAILDLLMRRGFDSQLGV